MARSRFCEPYVAGDSAHLSRCLLVLRICREVKFHVYTFIGSWPWCFLLAYAGDEMAQRLGDVGKYFHEFDEVIAGIIIAFVVWFVWTHWRGRVGQAA